MPRRTRAAGLGLRLHHERQPIEQLPHARRERAGELVEGAPHVLLERRRREALDERAREVQRAQLGEREAGVVEPPERLLLERPVALVVVDLVEQREAGHLQRLEVAADVRVETPVRSASSSIVSAPRRLEIAQDRPLADDFSVSGHNTVDSRQSAVDSP